MTDNDSLRVAFTTLGCKVNQSETDQLAHQFAAAGYRCVPFDAMADVYVVNTCTVTHVADKKSRQVLGQARRKNPDGLVVATGCYASIVGDMLADEHTMVVRNRDKDRLLTLVEGRLQRVSRDLPYFADAEKYVETAVGEVRSRSQVKVQDGCDSHCTYCIIPRARGRSRSVPVNDVLQRVNMLVQSGHAEIVITGVDIGSYGENDESLPDLGGLLRTILDRTEARRVRVSSLEPADFRVEWLSLWEDPRLCRHLHVPLQAGSESVLRRMERRYSPEMFKSMVDACRASIPNLTVTTDVIVGFPGETDNEFDDGYHFIRSVQFDGMHVFKYSQRSGTRAARMPDQVVDPVKQERSQLLREEAAAGVSRLHGRHHDTVATVAWEGEIETVWRGLTDTNVRVYGGREPVHAERLSRVRLTSPFRDGLWVEPASADIPLVAVS